MAMPCGLVPAAIVADESVKAPVLRLRLNTDIFAELQLVECFCRFMY